MRRIEKLITEGFMNIQNEMVDLKKYVDNNFFLIHNRLKFLDERMLQMACSNRKVIKEQKQYL